MYIYILKTREPSVLPPSEVRNEKKACMYPPPHLASLKSVKQDMCMVTCSWATESIS